MQRYSSHTLLVVWLLAFHSSPPTSVDALVWGGLSNPFGGNNNNNNNNSVKKAAPKSVPKSPAGGSFSPKYPKKQSPGAAPGAFGRSTSPSTPVRPAAPKNSMGGASLSSFNKKGGPGGQLKTTGGPNGPKATALGSGMNNGPKATALRSGMAAKKGPGGPGAAFGGRSPMGGGGGPTTLPRAGSSPPAAPAKKASFGPGPSSMSGSGAGMAPKKTGFGAGPPKKQGPGGAFQSSATSSFANTASKAVGAGGPGMKKSGPGMGGGASSFGSPGMKKTSNSASPGFPGAGGGGMGRGGPATTTRTASVTATPQSTLVAPPAATTRSAPKQSSSFSSPGSGMGARSSSSSSSYGSDNEGYGSSSRSTTSTTTASRPPPITSTNRGLINNVSNPPRTVSAPATPTRAMMAAQQLQAPNSRPGDFYGGDSFQPTDDDDISSLLDFMTQLEDYKLTPKEKKRRIASVMQKFVGAAGLRLDQIAEIGMEAQTSAYQKIKGFESRLLQQFPGAIANPKLVPTMVNMLSQRGFNQGKNTLLATSLCCDELARNLEDDLNSYYGNNFNLGGLAGFPFAGNTGFGAMTAHIPDGGYGLIVYGPHVGMTADGVVGKVERSGIELVDKCCGSAIAASNYVQGITNGQNPVTPDLRKFTDFQQTAVNKFILPHGQRLEQAGNDRMRELPFALYDSQDMLLWDIVQHGASKIKSGLALLGGIQINTGPNTPDYFLPMRFDLVNNQGMITEDLLEELFWRVEDGSVTGLRQAARPNVSPYRKQMEQQQLNQPRGNTMQPSTSPPSINPQQPRSYQRSNNNGESNLRPAKPYQSIYERAMAQEQRRQANERWSPALPQSEMAQQTQMYNQYRQGYNPLEPVYERQTPYQLNRQLDQQQQPIRWSPQGRDRQNTKFKSNYPANSLYDYDSQHWFEDKSHKPLSQEFGNSLYGDWNV